MRISTKATFAFGTGSSEVGSARHRQIKAVDASLKRLGTDHIDLFRRHGLDALTPQVEGMGTLNRLVGDGKLCDVGSSNFSGWHLIKSLAMSDRLGLVRHVAHQACYPLPGREFEHDLMPLALDQGVGTVVWIPLGRGRVSGRYRRSHPLDATSRAVQNGSFAPPVPDDRLYAVMEELDTLAAETGRAIAYEHNLL